MEYSDSEMDSPTDKEKGKILVTSRGGREIRELLAKSATYSNISRAIKILFNHFDWLILFSF